jgi:iduronate 2-sulfatase
MGRSTFVELVDLYPTLSEKCGLPHPQDIDGRSFSLVLRGADDTFRHHAISQFPRHQTKNRHTGSGDIMGYSIRTEKHRYVEWQRTDSKEVVATELYDLAADGIETTNIASMPSARDEVARLQELLQHRLTPGVIRSDR